jgi:transcription initiation factor IIF auxiliary subunit
MQKTVSDKELQSFAKAYVEVEEIRAVQKASLSQVQDPAQVQQLQQEANANMVKAVEKQELTPESYNQILAAVSSDEALIQTALEIMEKEKAS